MITVDLRWLRASGIGTYLRNVIPGIVANFPGERFCLLGDADDINKLGLLQYSNVFVVQTEAPMYSVREQLELARKIPKETKLYFATHYPIPLLYQGRMLVTIYDLFHLAMPEFVGGIHKRLYAHYMFGAVRRKADAIITISHFSKNELIRLTKGDRCQPIYPIHLGVDRSWFNVKGNGNPHGKPYLLYVGNVKPHKNLGALIKAFGLLADNIVHDLVLIGKKEGFITGDTTATLEGAKLKGRVHFIGHVDEDVLRQYMVHAEAFVFPSLYEGFGLPPLEAMAVRCPVVASNAASLPEVCGNAALYCDPHQPRDIADKVANLLKNETLRQVLVNKGDAHVRQFKWEACVEETCAVVADLLRPDAP